MISECKQLANIASDIFYWNFETPAVCSFDRIYGQDLECAILICIRHNKIMYI